MMGGKNFGKKIKENNLGVVDLERERFRVEIRIRASRRAWGLVDHYFLVINGQEYHPGQYGWGNVLPEGFTKQAHTVAEHMVCRQCHDKIVLNYNCLEDKRLFNFYPFINCETICTGLSLQPFIPLTIAPIFLYVLICRRQILLAIVIILITLCLHLSISKYMYSRPIKRYTCPCLDSPHHLPPPTSVLD